MIAYKSHGITAPVRFNSYKDLKYSTYMSGAVPEECSRPTDLTNFLVILVSLAKNACSIMG